MALTEDETKPGKELMKRKIPHEGWDRGRGYGDICMHVPDSLCCTTETNTVLWSTYTPIKIYLKKRSLWNYPEFCLEW